MHQRVILEFFFKVWNQVQAHARQQKVMTNVGNGELLIDTVSGMNEGGQRDCHHHVQTQILCTLTL